MVWLAIFPALTLILWLIGLRLQSWLLPLRTLVTTAILVPLMQWSCCSPEGRNAPRPLDEAFARVSR